MAWAGILDEIRSWDDQMTMICIIAYNARQRQRLDPGRK
jgi:hypothetical protein